MDNSDLYGLMATAMEGPETHPPQIMCGLPINEVQESWYWIKDGKFTSLLAKAADINATAWSATSLRDDLAVCVNLPSAVQTITDALVARLAKLMMVPASDIDAGRPMSSYGVDSLVAVEVRNWIAKEMLVEVSVFDLLANTPISMLAASLAGRCKLLEGLSSEGVVD